MALMTRPVPGGRMRIVPEVAPDEVIVAASEAGRRAFEVAKALSSDPADWRMAAGHAIVHYAYLAGWRDASLTVVPAADTAREREGG